MPVEDCRTTVDGEERPGRRWGEQGTCYPCRSDGNGGWDCSEAEARAEEQGAAIEARRNQEQYLMAEDNGMRWQGVIAVEGEPTGDGRMMEKGALRWEDGPWPLVWNREDGSHEASVVGYADEIWRDGNLIMASGYLSDSEDDQTQSDVTRVKELFDEGAIGASVRLDDESVEIRVDKEAIDQQQEEMERMMEGEDPIEGAEPDEDGRITVMRFDSKAELEVTTDARIRHIAVVDTPAFAETTLEIAKERARQQTGTDDSGESTPDDSGEEAAALDLNDFEFPSEFPFTDVAECAESLSGEPGIDDAEAFCTEWQRRIAEDGEGDEDGEGEGEAPPAAASLAASGYHIHRDARIALVSSIDADAFANPQFGFDPDEDPRLVRQDAERPGEQVTYGCPLTVTDDGRVYGHAALWGRCHAGFSNRCVTPPRGESYDRFLTGSAIPGVRTGPLTVGTTHADLMYDSTEAMDHYADTGRAVADVTVGEDRYGIWGSGRLRPDATDEDVAALRGSSLSGDWRPIGDRLRLVGILAVNQPGFMVQRDSRQADEAMAAAITVGPCCADTALTAQADQPTGAMIALVPTAASADALALEAGLDPEDLHVTVAFLGEAGDVDDDQREQIREQVETASQELQAGTGLAFGYGVFNPQGEDGDPVIVLLATGAVLEDARSALGDLDVGDRPRWIPHITLGSPDDVEDLKQLGDRTGEVAFDRVRVAFGDDVTDFELPGAGEMQAAAPSAAEYQELKSQMEAMRERLQAMEVIAGDFLVRDVARSAEQRSRSGRQP